MTQVSTSPPGMALLQLVAALGGYSRSEPHRRQIDHGSEIERLRARDAETWEAFFRAEMPAVTRYLHSRLGSAEEAEEIAADVFVEAWEHVGQLADRGVPARAWVFGIARNLAMMRRRSLFRRPPPLSIESVQSQGDSPPPEEYLDLARAIQSLEQSHAEVVLLRFIHDLSLAETAAVLRISVDAVKGRQARALAELQRRLSPGR